METSDLLKKVRKIEIKTRGLSRNIFAGEYHSAFKGRGMAFSEVREYQYGDDVRNIDWNVTARFNHPYIKVFEEERELTVMLLVDVSGSGFFGTRKQLKRDLITEITAVLSFSAIQNNDKIGIIMFSDHIEKFIPPKKGKTHILRIIRELIDFQPKGNKTHLSEGLRYFTNVVKKRSTAFLISDFWASDYEKALRVASYRHDLIALRVQDQHEQQLPPLGLVPVRDAESGHLRWVDSSSRKTRKAFRQYWQQHNDYFLQLMNKTGTDHATVLTHQDYVKPLRELFKRRAI